MAAAPRTLAADEPFDDIGVFLEHLYFHLMACALTQTLAADIDPLLTALDTTRAARRALARAYLALKSKEVFTDDELNAILDAVKAALLADTSDAGVELYNDVFENKSPSETRKYIVGKQLTVMTFWPGKLATSSRQEVLDLGVKTKTSTTSATALVDSIGGAASALDQFDAGPRAAFVDQCNGAVKIVYGKLCDLEHNPPNGPLAPGFVDRFFLRDTSGRVRTIKELEGALARTKTRVTKLETELKDRLDKQEQDAKDKQDALAAALQAEAAAAQKVIDDAAAKLAKIQAEIEKNKPAPPPPPPPPAGP
jgi:hypothetical protein